MSFYYHYPNPRPYRGPLKRHYWPRVLAMRARTIAFALILTMSALVILLQTPQFRAYRNMKRIGAQQVDIGWMIR